MQHKIVKRRAARKSAKQKVKAIYPKAHCSLTVIGYVVWKDSASLDWIVDGRPTSHDAWSRAAIKCRLGDEKIKFSKTLEAFLRG